MNSVVLLGAETVQSAAHRMQEAAERFASAVSQMEFAFQQRRLWEEEYLQRLAELREATRDA